jgi:uncharacterized protein YkwD
MRLKLRALFAALAIAAMLFLAACDPPSEAWDLAAVNNLRAAHGLQALVRIHERAQGALEESPPHLANLLRPDYSEVGIGVTIKDGRYYLVQVFVAR